ncbi:MAG: hypothetical protein RLZZ543_444 [Bacteroidota bacterium]|jgi:hypothetical protein
MRFSFSHLGLLLSSILFISCGKEPADMEDPHVLAITSPEDSAQITDNTLHFEATLSDNIKLSYYKLQIVPTSENYSSEDTMALSYWDFTRVFEIDGMAANVFPDISIPDTIASGWYNMIVNTVDASGNLSQNDTATIYIRSQIDYFTPVVLLHWPADLQVFTSSDTLTATASVTDNLGLSSTLFKVYDASNQLLHSASLISTGTNNDVAFQFPLAGLSAGSYRFEITQYDRALNAASQSRMFGVQ